MRDIIAGGEQRQINFAFGTKLGETDGGHEAVADTLAAFRFCRRAAFAEAKLTDMAGKLYVSASSTLLIT